MRAQVETALNYHPLSPPPSRSTSPDSGYPGSDYPDEYLFASEPTTPLRADTSLVFTADATSSGATADLRTAMALSHPTLDASFGAANKDDGNADLLRAHIADLFNTSRTIRAEIGQIALTEATQRSQAIRSANGILNTQQVLQNQTFCIDETTGKGLPYLHERDKPFAAMLEDSDRRVFTFLPGYATGDRYTLIIAALVETRLNVVIGHAVGGDAKEAQKQARDARTAYDVLVNALEKNGVANARERVSLSEFDGDAKALKQARESLDDTSTRERFRSTAAADGETLLRQIGGDDHIFHISVTTELIRRQFAREDISATQLHGEIRERLWHLVEPKTRLRIEEAVDRIVAHYQLDEKSVALWIADREGANERESQAISRPLMFEQMAQRFEQDGFKVFDVADTYINPAASIPRGTFDRHPYRPEIRPQIGRFWNGNFNGEKLLAPRENQWYFMDRLLSKTGSRMVGIRSGALEPLALLGHKVAYLEHKDMFTPERHASWQGYIPYYRVITENTTGYMSSYVNLHPLGEPATSLEAETELTAARLQRTLIDTSLQSKQLMQGGISLDVDTPRGKQPIDTLLASHIDTFVKEQTPESDGQTQASWQRMARLISREVRDDLERVQTSIQSGLLHPAELDLIAEKLDIPSQTARSGPDLA